MSHDSSPVISRLAFNFISDQLLQAEYSRLQHQINNIPFQNPRQATRSTPKAGAAAAQSRGSGGREQSWRPSTLTSCVCQCCEPPPPGPAVARWVSISCCCHVIFAQVAALSWWGPIRCEWPSEALSPAASNPILPAISLDSSEESALVRTLNQTSQLSSFCPVLS